MRNRPRIYWVILLFWASLGAAGPSSEQPPESSGCLEQVVESFFTTELEADEIDPVLVLARFQRQLSLTENSLRPRLARLTFSQMQDDLSAWDFVEREYQGGLLFCGPYGHLRWLDRHGNLLKARLPQNYWSRRDQDDRRYPLRRELDRLTWKTVVKALPPN